MRSLDSLRVQINDYDTYQSYPTRLDQYYSKVLQVPIIRIYGSITVDENIISRNYLSPTKKKHKHKSDTPSYVFNVVIHVHNFYPYLYVDCRDQDYAKLSQRSHINKVIDHLEEALKISYANGRYRKKNEEDLSEDDDDQYEAPSTTSYKQSSTKRRYIANVSICKAVPMYGFQIGYNLFYKISLLSPNYKPRLTKLFQENKLSLHNIGREDNNKTRNYDAHYVFEAHIPHLLQFLTDFNLFGCGWLYIDKDHIRDGSNTKSLYFRSPIVNEALKSAYTKTQFDVLLRYLTNFVTHDNVLKGNDLDNEGIGPFTRIGKSVLEIDISTSGITNRTWLSPRQLHDNFTERKEYDEYNASIQDGKNPQHGYKYDEFGNPRIYLSSLKQIYNDLKYQCDIRNSSLELYSDVLATTNELSYFGTGSTNWSNQQRLNELLEYAIQLTGSNELDMEKYADTYLTNLKSRKINGNDMFDKFKTSFDLVDYEKELQYHNIPMRPGIDINNISHSSSSIEDITFTPSLEGTNHMGLNIGDNCYEVVIPDSVKPENINNTFQKAGKLKINYQDPFYDNLNDIPTKPFVFANKKIVVPLKDSSSIPMTSSTKMIHDNLQDDTETRKCIRSRKFYTWQYLQDPPSKQNVQTWAKLEEEKLQRRALKYGSQDEPGITQSYDFKFSYNSMKIARRPNGYNSLTCFSMEIHADPPNSKLTVDPLRDPISIVFYSFDDKNGMFNHFEYTSGILIFNTRKYSEQFISQLSSSLKKNIELFDDEVEMTARLVQLIEIFDPDILAGYEINAMSWGYIIERLRNVFDINILADFSRGSDKSNGKFGDRWGYTHTSNIEINGRHMFNVWRLLRSDLSLTSYSLENVSYHLLHRSLPRYSNYQLSQWLSTGTFSNVLVALSYYSTRIDMVIKIIEVQELITRNVEHSRLIGIEFNANFYRGSQFKVESILARLTKSESLLLNSPSKQQKSPLVVLDFQSLYPSIMIAYNYCYSTLLGKLNNFSPNMNDIGYLDNLKIPPGMIDLLKKDNAINISPNGFIFVKSNVRKSILAKMLEEFLALRIKVKAVTKSFRDDTELTRVYNSRQLALKLIANVTYGYTSATFSGRMPNSDISDAIVSTGREILMKSIELIEAGNYGAKVVYGDTDSLFVYFPGKSKDEAFKLGKSIAQYITSVFPDPVKLKFEKVYHPCVLLTKKRYVGYAYEYEDQKVPKFDAKGIETVRRDGIPAQSKMTEKALRILFETQNLSKVKEYTLKQFYKISINKISVQDFCFAKEVRYGTYKNEKYLPPGAVVANKMVEDDPRKEPQYRERVPYVIIQDATKHRIKDRCISPEDLIASYKTDKPLMLDYEYYITRVLIPPLARVFNLLGVDVKGWYRELPSFSQSRSRLLRNDGLLQSGVLNSHTCLSCHEKLDLNNSMVCSSCTSDEQQLVATICSECRENELRVRKLEKLCKDCVYSAFGNKGNNITNQSAENCSNKDCSVYYKKFRSQNDRDLSKFPGTYVQHRPLDHQSLLHPSIQCRD
ncbi:DNA polymerase zeta [Spathaspora passalidarum NRRL Y-27907]|uniref:DNA polymerase n=1 Tax=Spathaspora passalidarum (strain NRRL Y-27907 / 11-Y1) TaxID=619300 RepID=G3ARA4_SPAPN|nr:DNA polymerase zeta [Spathaspora passalidarum NRRL Y-27907]EGW31711.1 DNA polymerase zeta [Spathaspora passalidarum NRRL Y-27907]